MTIINDVNFLKLIFFLFELMSCKVCGPDSVAKIILFEGSEEAHVEYCSANCFNKS
jgi:hypothetical protein